MKRATLWITIYSILAAFGSQHQAMADGDIVYSAQRYGWSGKFYKDDFDGKPTPMLRNLGSFHLYRINVDGSRCKQITFGRYHDSGAAWSPDGRGIAFLRGSAAFEPQRLCVLDMRNAHLVTLRRYSGTRIATGLEWSPDGRTIALMYSANGTSTCGVDLIAVDGSRSKNRRLINATSFAWSPVGDKYFTSTADGSPTIHFVRRRRSILVLPPVENVIWLSEHTLVGELRDGPGAHQHFPRGLELFSDTGRLLRRITIDRPFNGEDKTEDKDVYETLAADRSWHRIGKDPIRLLLSVPDG